MLRFFIIFSVVVSIQLQATSFETFSKSANSKHGGFIATVPSNQINLPHYSKYIRVKRFTITDINISKLPSKFRCDGYVGDTIRFDLVLSSTPTASKKVILRLIQNHTRKSFDIPMQKISSVHYRYEAVLDQSEKVWNVRLGLVNRDTKRVKTIARKRIRLCSRPKQTPINIMKIHTIDKSIDITNITPHLHKVFSVKTEETSLHHLTRWPARVYATIVFEGNKKILGFIDNDAKHIRWINGKIIDIKPDYIVRLFSNQDIYLLIHLEQEESRAAVYDANHQIFIKFPGYLKALKDIDGDGVPEVITQEKDDKHIVRLLKITHKDGKMGVVTLARHPHPNRSNDGAFQFDIIDNRLYLHPIKWISEEGVVIIKSIKQSTYADKPSARKALEQYFTRWSKSDIVYKQSAKNGVKYQFLKDYSTHFKLSDIDKIRLESDGDPHGGCLDIYSRYNQKKGIPKIESIVLCKRGKGVVRCQNGLLFVFDTDIDMLHFVSLGGDRYAIATNNYVILTDNKSKQTVYWQWKELIGFQPIAVKYFDGKFVLFAKKNQKYTSLEGYRLTFEKEQKVVEQW